MCQSRKQAECEAEAMEEWRWTAQNVLLCEIHSISNKARIVHEVATFISIRIWGGESRRVLLVCQHGSFGVTCAATRELKIGDVMRTDYAIVDLQDMFRYALSFTK